MKKIVVLLCIMLSFKAEAQTSALNVADSLEQLGDYQGALKHLKDVMPPTFESLESMGRIYQFKGDYSKAITNYKKAKEQMEDTFVNIQLAKCYQLAGFTDKAIDQYEGVLKVDSTNVMVKYTLAKIYATSKNKRAATLFKELERQDPENPNYSYRLGLFYSKMNKFNEMGNSFLRSYKKDTMHLKSIYQLAKFYKRLKFKDSTELFMNKGLSINPTSVNFLKLKIAALHKAKKYQEVIDHSKYLDSIRPNLLFANRLQGLSYLKLKNYKMAEKYLQKALKIDRSDKNTYYYLGLLYLEVKQFKRAKMFLHLGIMMSKPDLDNEYYTLGLISLEEEKPKEALTNFEKAFKNSRRNHRALYQMISLTDKMYKDKTIVYKHLEDYLSRFESKDEKLTTFVKLRMKEIEKMYFMKGQKIK